MARKGTYSRPRAEKALESARKTVRGIEKAVRGAPKDIQSGTRSLGRMGKAAADTVKEGYRKIRKAVK